jgi:DNA-directed RNA polymerase subunit RPC12/RpoP
MSRYSYFCSKCVAEKHRIEAIRFPHGFGIEKTLIDGKEADAVLLSPSRKRKCADCGKKIRHAWRIKKEEV